MIGTSKSLVDKGLENIQERSRLKSWVHQRAKQVQGMGIPKSEADIGHGYTKERSMYKSWVYQRAVQV